jgi:hypothetical protein
MLSELMCGLFPFWDSSGSWSHLLPDSGQGLTHFRVLVSEFWAPDAFRMSIKRNGNPRKTDMEGGDKGDKKEDRTEKLTSVTPASSELKGDSQGLHSRGQLAHYPPNPPSTHTLWVLCSGPSAQEDRWGKIW